MGDTILGQLVIVLFPKVWWEGYPAPLLQDVQQLFAASNVKVSPSNGFKILSHARGPAFPSESVLRARVGRRGKASLGPSLFRQVQVLGEDLTDRQSHEWPSTGKVAKADLSIQSNLLKKHGAKERKGEDFFSVILC